jgi:hypothetical protein
MKTEVEVVLVGLGYFGLRHLPSVKESGEAVEHVIMKDGFEDM